MLKQTYISRNHYNYTVSQANYQKYISPSLGPRPNIQYSIPSFNCPPFPAAANTFRNPGNYPNPLPNNPYGNKIPVSSLYIPYYFCEQKPSPARFDLILIATLILVSLDLIFVR